MQSLPENEPESVKRWSWKWTLATVLLLLTGAAAAILLTDEELQPYDDLKLTGSPVPDAGTNGYLYLRERWENLPKIPAGDSEKLRNMTLGKIPPDVALVDKLHKGFEKTTQEWRTALAMPEWLLPRPATDFSALSEAWVMSPLRLFFLDARTTLRAGDAGPAVTLQQEMGSWLRKNMAGEGGLISALVTVSLQAMVAELSCETLASVKADAAQVEAMEKLWRDDPDFLTAWRSAIRGESLFLENVLKLVASGNRQQLKDLGELKEGSLRSRLLLKKNKTLNAARAELRKKLNLTFQPYPSQQAARDAGVGEQPVKPVSPLRYLDANFTGTKLLGGEDSIAKIIPSLYRVFFVPRAMRVRIAIYRWQQAHPGQWPARLEELVPDYLPEVPKDPWIGNPLMWDQSARVIYAVGTDWKPDLPVFKSDSRTWFADKHEAPGLRMEMPTAPPPAAPRDRRVVLGNPEATGE